MLINPNYPTQQSGIISNEAYVYKEPPVDSKSKLDDKVNISNHAYYAETNWQNIASRYDVTNISNQDRANLAGELQEKGLISGEVGIFIAMPLNTSQNPNEKTNFIDVANQSLQNSINGGASREQIELRKKAINFLEHLNQLN